MIRNLLLLIAVAALAVPGWLVSSYKPSAPEVPIGAEDPFGPGGPLVPAAEVDRLRDMADNACRCTRRSGNEASCWSGYDKAVSRYRTTRLVSACIPLSSTMICFSGGNCIEIDRGHPGKLLCSASERQAMEATWNGEMAKSHGESDAEGQRALDRAGAAMDRVYRRILRGESLADIRGKSGCSG